jgi:hypothetical protein
LPFGACRYTCVNASVTIHRLYGSIHLVGAMAGKARQLPLSSGVTPEASAKHVRASVLA